MFDNLKVMNVKPSDKSLKFEFTDDFKVQCINEENVSNGVVSKDNIIYNNNQDNNDEETKDAKIKEDGALKENDIKLNKSPKEDTSEYDNNKEESKSQKEEKPKEKISGIDLTKFPVAKPVELPNILDAEKYFNNIIRDQQVPIHKLITALYKSLLFTEQKSNILAVSKETVHLVGAIKYFCETCGIPFAVDDSASSVKLNYEKGVITNIAVNFYNSNIKYVSHYPSENLLTIPYGVVILTNVDSYPQGVYQEHLVHEYFHNDLAQLIKGERIPLTSTSGQPIAYIDTSRITFILVGEFKGLRKIQYQDTTETKMGFNVHSDKEIDYDYISKEQIIKYGDGVGSKLLENITDIIHMQPVTTDSMKRFLTTSISSPFLKYYKLLSQYNIKLYYENTVIDEIVDEAKKHDEDFKDLDTLIGNIFTEILFLIFRYQGMTLPFNACKLLSGVTKDNTKFQLLRVVPKEESDAKKQNEDSKEDK